jgi:hypothetical protein
MVVWLVCLVRISVSWVVVCVAVIAWLIPVPVSLLLLVAIAAMETSSSPTAQISMKVVTESIWTANIATALVFIVEALWVVLVIVALIIVHALLLCLLVATAMSRNPIAQGLMSSVMEPTWIARFALASLATQQEPCVVAEIVALIIQTASASLRGVVTELRTKHLKNVMALTWAVRAAKA